MEFFDSDSGIISVIIQSLCRTLLHSLWQGLILVMVTGFILSGTTKSKPALRYNLLALSLLVFFISSCLTFYITFNHQNGKLANSCNRTFAECYN